MRGPPSTVVTKDASALARAAADRFAGIIASAARFTVALSGGSTPKRFYETLAAPPLRERVAWDRVEIFFGDERAVPPDHADSNYGMTRRALLDHVAVTAHRMPADSGDAEGYEDLLRGRLGDGNGGVPVFDLVLLGIGTDGHTASLFPGTAALRESKRLVVMNDVPQLDTRRMTFTYPLINAARRVWIFAAGADKRDIVSKCLVRSGDFPILGVEPRNGELLWWLDEAAAA